MLSCIQELIQGTLVNSQGLLKRNKSGTSDELGRVTHRGRSKSIKQRADLCQ